LSKKPLHLSEKVQYVNRPRAPHAIRSIHHSSDRPQAPNGWTLANLPLFPNQFAGCRWSIAGSIHRIAATIPRDHDPPIHFPDDPLTAQSAYGDHDRNAQASAANVSDAVPKLAGLGVFEESVISALENAIAFIVNIRKCGRENNEEQVAKINLALRGEFARFRRSPFAFRWLISVRCSQ
jgi:hypothetical protein